MALSLKRMVRGALIALPLVFLMVFFYYPLAGVLQEGVIDEAGPTLQYLKEIFRDSYFRRIILFTAEQALLSTLAAILLGLPWAYILTRYDFPGKKLARAFTIVPFVLPPITVALGFILLFGHNGVLNRWLMALFSLDKPPLRILYSLQGIVLAHAFYNAPIIARFVNAAWERLDPSYEEQARALGASPFHVFKDVTLPMLMPSLLSGSALAFIYSFLSFPIVLTLGGAQFSTIEVAIYHQVMTRPDIELGYKMGAALALVGIALSLAFAYGYIRIQGLYARQIETTKPPKTVPLFSVGKFTSYQVDKLKSHNVPTVLGKLVLVFFILLSAFFFIGPMLAVFFDSITREWAGQRTFTVYWYSFIFRPDYDAIIGASPLGSILNSLAFALTTMLVGLIVGTPLAFVIARFGFRGRRLFDTLIMAPLGISSIALAFGLLRVFLRWPFALLGPWVAIVIAHSISAYPFVIRAMAPVLESVDRTLVEAARSLGASRWMAFKTIELPLIAIGALVGAVFAFAISIGETSATLMLSQPGLKTMPVVVYNFLSARIFGAASAMSVLLIITVGAAFVVIERLGERVLR